MPFTLALVALLFLSPLSFGVLIVSLPAAISLYNKIASGSLSRAAIPATPVNPMMVLAFVATLLYHFVPIFVALASGTAAAVVVAVVCGILIMAGLFRPAYQLSFGRGLLLAGCHFAIAMLVVLVILAIVQSAIAKWHFVIIPPVRQN